MGERRNPLDPSCFAVSYALGNRLIELYRHDCPESRRFKVIAREIQTFHASYQMIRPFLQEPIVYLSATCLDMVQNIHDASTAICEGIAHDVRRLKDDIKTGLRNNRKRENSFFFAGKRFDQNKHIKKFFDKKNRYSLERFQLRYFCMLLSLILAVLVYAQQIHDDDDAVSFVDTSSYMIGDLHEALADLEEKETDERTRRRIPNLPVQASHIWRGFPFALQPGDNVSPLRRLMTLWVNPEAQWASHPTADVATARDTIRQWRERNEQLQAELGRLYRDNQQLSIDNEDLTAENSRLRADQAEADATQQDLEQIIEALQQSITQLRDELAKERNNGYEQEHHVRQYRSDKNHLKRRLAEAAAEREDAEDRARGALKDYEDLSHEFREFRRRHGEGCRGQDRGRRPSRRNMSPGLGGPPSTFETRGYADNRRRQSSSRRPNVTSSGWNAGNGQNHAPDSPPAPPIPYRSRPFRAELDADE